MHNSNSHLKPIIAPSQQLEHAVQALCCVKTCQMGIAGQADGWNPKSDMLKGPFIRAKHMQADLATCTGSLNSRHLTVTQYRAYLNEGWTFKTTPEHALTGMLMVVEATTATNCGLSNDNTGCQHRLTVISPLSWHSCRLSQMGHWFASELLPTVGLVLKDSGKWSFQ